ncbi:DUF4190 domain-containing protein [Lysobacter sp. GX 14042]|uniref:DUF4190 domain-containing protein n=1 Tax=Lysobacter sp. GX 14042 TaxID=2907155 RepID=UPI001F487F59|nr:DUF4190 domain-containing protein [Lysobacter sp. GX 14042]MCE7032626.1 DUF4190 domain-containing protein [Lysobacter sp. GX 14042]
MEPTSGTPSPMPPALPAGGRQTSALAIASLVTGVLSWVVAPVVASLVAVVCGHLARAEIRREPGRLEGDGLAVAGLILGYANLATAALALLVAVVFFGGLLGLGALGAGWA